MSNTKKFCSCILCELSALNKTVMYTINQQYYKCTYNDWYKNASDIECCVTIYIINNRELAKI
jgi:hypothetical protein